MTTCEPRGIDDSGELQKMRDEVQESTRVALSRGAYFWFAMVATAVLSAGSSMMVSVVLTNRSERKLCAVVITSDDAFHRTPSQNPDVLKQANNFSRLRKELGCPPFKE